MSLIVSPFVSPIVSPIVCPIVRPSGYTSRLVTQAVWLHRPSGYTEAVWLHRSRLVTKAGLSGYTVIQVKDVDPGSARSCYGRSSGCICVCILCDISYGYSIVVGLNCSASVGDVYLYIV